MKKFVAACLWVVLAAACAALLVGCGGGGDPARLRRQAVARITDAPVDDATAVVVKFTAIELKPESGDAFTIDPSIPRRRSTCSHSPAAARASC